MSAASTSVLPTVACHIISGIIEEREQLLVSSESAFRARYRVDVRSQTEAIAIDRKAKTVRLRNLVSNDEYDESYDKLLLSPGAEPVRPKLPGIDSPRIFGLRNIPDLDRIIAHLDTQKPRRAVVIGGGFIGIEVAENLHERGIFTTLVEAADQILTPLDYEMAAIVHAHMRDKNVELYLEDKVEQFEERDDHTIVYLGSGRRLQADLVILAIGVRPETTLARACGLELGVTGGMRVNHHLQTTDPDIYAVGDAIEITQTISGKQMLILWLDLPIVRDALRLITSSSETTKRIAAPRAQRSSRHLIWPQHPPASMKNSSMLLAFRF